MFKFIFGLFIILHGLVHLLYGGHARRLFELPGLAWPDGSWVFSRYLGTYGIRLVAGIALLLAAIAFVVAGIGLFANQDWWRPLMVGAAVFSGLIWILFWDGTMARLDGQGLIAILIDLGLIVSVQLFHWPK